MTYRFGSGPETNIPITPGTTAVFDLTITLPAGFDTIVVTAYDTAGNVGTGTTTARYSVSRLIAAQLVDNKTQVAVFDVDGDCRRTTAATGETGNTGWANMAWNPTQTSLAFQSSGGGAQRIYVGGVSGDFVRLLPNSTFAAEFTPTISTDGQWIYFSAGNVDALTGGVSASIWRAHLDGSGLQEISPHATGSANYEFPSPSPDGKRVAFLSDGYPYDRKLYMLDVTSRTITYMNQLGGAPRWSPTDNFVAYTDNTRGDGNGAIVLLDPDSGVRRMLTAAGSFYQQGISWSADGRSVLARNVTSNRLEAIEVATGRVTLIPGSSNLFNPVW